MAALERVVGTVSRVNGSGFQLQERPGAWLNISQYAQPKPELPTMGQQVRAGLDGKGFVRTLEVVGENGHSEAQTPAAAGSGRDVVIARLACLKAAAEFLASRPEAKSPDVLKVAEAFEAWVAR